MDFTLSLAHFCELHGPTSVISTQTLAIDCDRCYPYSNSSSSTPTSIENHFQSYFAQQSRRRQPSLAPYQAKAADSERCDSCSVKSPEKIADPREVSVFISKEKNVPFRTREDVHICADAGTVDDAEVNHNIRCHSHNMEYVSSSSPTEPKTFVALRNATVRTLSGEQLPKGQRSGPLCFGDSATGYTVAYYFRLADGHARGKERYYALLALVGTDTRRAFESCTLIWNLFEQIALYIINMAEEALQRSKPKFEVDKSERENLITPVSSFLTQRALHPDGVPRRGTESVRANNITELVDNANFFCELHMMFVKMLQELGKIFGGMKINPKADETNILLPGNKVLNISTKIKAVQDNDEDDFRMSPLPPEPDLSELPTRSVPRFEIPHHSSLTPSPSPERQTVLG